MMTGVLLMSALLGLEVLQYFALWEVLLTSLFDDFLGLLQVVLVLVLDNPSLESEACLLLLDFLYQGLFFFSLLYFAWSIGEAHTSSLLK